MEVAQDIRYTTMITVMINALLALYLVMGHVFLFNVEMDMS